MASKQQIQQRKGRGREAQSYVNRELQGPRRRDPRSLSDVRVQSRMYLAAQKPEQGEMVCGCCFGCIIVLMNTLFGLLAILLIAIGSLLHFISDIAKTYLQTFIDGMKSTFEGFGMSLDDILNGDKTFSIIDMLKQVAIPFIVVGVILFVICILGCCSVYCSNRTLLIVYMTILGAILAAQILAAVIVYVKVPDYRGNAIEGLKTSITNDYEGRNGTNGNTTTNLFTMFVDIVQSQVGCCGVDNYTNFETASKWQARKDPRQKVPITCCVFENFEPKDLEKCAPADDPKYAHIETPCFNKVEDMLGDANLRTPLLAAVFGILALQLLILLLTICYCQTLKFKIGPV